MPTFTKVQLQELVMGVSNELETVSDRITGKGRWSIDHELVFREVATGRYYQVDYSEGATEYQTEEPFEYAEDMVEVVEVHPVKQTITVYVPISTK